MSYPSFEPPAIFGPGIQKTPDISDEEFLANLSKYVNGEIRSLVVPQGVAYKMPEYVELTISRERMEVIVTHLQSLLDNTNAEEFDLTVSKEKFAVQPVLPRMEIVLEKEKK